jgi:hypothetical protein
MSAVYVESLIKSGSAGLANTILDDRHWHLVQDGASCHINTQSLDALFEIWNVFPEWLLNSPDLNITECLWWVSKRRLQWNRIQTREDAIRAIQTTWSDFQ